MSTQATDPQVTDKDAFLTHYAEAKSDLPGVKQDWVRDLREQGISLFDKTGLPTGKTEAWKFTNLNILRRQPLNLWRGESESPKAEALPGLLSSGEAHRIVFVDGRYNASLSDADLPQGVKLRSFAAAIDAGEGDLQEDLKARSLADDQPLVALNTALMSDGFLLEVAKDTLVEKPIEILHLGGKEGVSYHTRNLIKVGFGSKVTVLEKIADLRDAVYFANSNTDVQVAANASLFHYKAQQASASGLQYAAIAAEVQAGARYDCFILNTGARLARHEISVKLAAENSSCHINGAYMGNGEQHCDITTRIDHTVAHTTCDEVIKGVLNGKSRGVFQGKIVVHEQAQKTVGNQSHKALLLSEMAEVDAKPELEIFADDVICSHGCTAGQVNDEQLFYLRSRGLSREAAQALLVQAFLADAVEEMQNEDYKEVFQALIVEWLGNNL